MEETTALEVLIAEECDFDAVGHAAHWALFFEDLDELGRMLPLIGEAAQPLLTCADDENSAPLPLSPSEPAASLVIWPHPDRGMVQILTDGFSEGDRRSIESAYPWTADGVVHMTKIESLRLWPGRLEAQIQAKIGDGLSITFFDSHFAKNRVFYRPGGFYPMVLTGWAYEIRIYEDTLGADRQKGEIGPPCRLVPDGNSPDEYAFIGEVVDAKTVRFFNSPVTLLRVTVGQFHLPFSERFDIDLMVPDGALGFSRAPDIGDHVFGRLWLTGYLRKPEGDSEG